jgi:glycosyltransferase involved in cell wall biosynthesis
MKKKLVISAVNLTEGGPLTVLRECVESAALVLPNWEIIVLAHNATLIKTPGVEVQAFPRAKSSWLRRIWLEWVGFKPISQELKADLWLSLHDITPRVQAVRQAVYCHNAAIFYRLSLREVFVEPKLLLFSLFYGVLYGAFIGRNRHVIVQQSWLRDEFRHRFGERSIVVAHPSQMTPQTPGYVRLGHPTTIFFYPALARVFKNMEVLCEAAAILESRGFDEFEVRLTLTGDENRYARWLRSRFAGLSSVKFIGLQDIRQMRQQYSEATAVVFPSRLETWGLPITEAKVHQLPLLVADAPYARETVGTYNTVSFFPPREAEVLANLMQALIEGNWVPSGNEGSMPAEPFAQDWPQLLHLLTSDLDPTLPPSTRTQKHD